MLEGHEFWVTVILKNVLCERAQESQYHPAAGPIHC